MKIAKALLTQSERARADAAADATTRTYWLGLSGTWQAMLDIHQDERTGDFDFAQIEAVRAKVDETRALVREQMREVDEMRRRGTISPSARALLDVYCETLSLHCDCLEKLIRESRKKRVR